MLAQFVSMNTSIEPFITISEPEVLIALDIERIVRLAFPMLADIKVLALDDLLATDIHVDLAVCDVGERVDVCRAALDQLSSRGTAIIVITTLDETLLSNWPWPVIQKPFLDEVLLAQIGLAFANGR